MSDDRPTFWGECGVVSTAKLSDILRRHRSTRFVFSKWAMPVQPFAAEIERVLVGTRRSAPVELIRFPDEARELVAENGGITITARDVSIQRWD